MRCGVAVLVVLAALTRPAFAATDTVPNEGALSPPEFNAEPVFRDLNLLGQWAVACDKPAAPANPHIDVTAPGGGLIAETHDIGPDYAANLYHIVAARRIDAHDVEVKALFRPGSEGEEAQTLLIHIDKVKGVDSRRTMFNRGADGEVRVKNGVTVRSGAKTAVLRRCE